MRLFCLQIQRVFRPNRIQTELQLLISTISRLPGNALASIDYFVLTVWGVSCDTCIWPLCQTRTRKGLSEFGQSKSRCLFSDVSFAVPIETWRLSREQQVRRSPVEIALPIESKLASSKPSLFKSKSGFSELRFGRTNIWGKFCVIIFRVTCCPCD